MVGKRRKASSENKDHASDEIRERVKRHLKKLIATSALVGLTLPGLSACEEQVVCDPLPPPDGGDVLHRGDVGGDVLHRGDAGGDPPVVCDPLPPPDGGGGDP